MSISAALAAFRGAFLKTNFDTHSYISVLKIGRSSEQFLFFNCFVTKKHIK
jgi:hypothetical protein